MISAEVHCSGLVCDRGNANQSITPLFHMKEADSGLVRYRGHLMTKAKAEIIKRCMLINKARKYAPKGVDPNTLIPKRPEPKLKWDQAIKILEERYRRGLDVQKET